MVNDTETTDNKVLTLADMLATKLEREEVDCPEWGGVVPIRELTAEDRSTMTKKLSVKGKMDWDKVDQFAPFLLVHGVTDADGDIYLSNKDAEALCRKSSKIVDRIAKAIAKLSGLTSEAATEKVKN